MLNTGCCVTGISMRPSHRVVNQALAAVQSGVSQFVAPCDGDVSTCSSSSSTHSCQTKQHNVARSSLHPGMRMVFTSCQNNRDNSSGTTTAALHRVAGSSSALLISSMRPPVQQMDEDAQLDCGSGAASNLPVGTNSSNKHLLQEHKQSLLAQQLHLNCLHAAAHQQLLRARVRRKQHHLAIESDSSSSSTPVSHSAVGSNNSTPLLHPHQQHPTSPPGAAEGADGATPANMARAGHEQPGSEAATDSSDQPGVAPNEAHAVHSIAANLSCWPHQQQQQHDDSLRPDSMCCSDAEQDSDKAADSADLALHVTATYREHGSLSSCMHHVATVSSKLSQIAESDEDMPLAVAIPSPARGPTAAAADVAPLAAPVLVVAAPTMSLPMCVYSASTDTVALEHANRVVAQLKLPDGVHYLPVVPDSIMFKLAAGWQLPAFVTCLGSSYYQRMLHRVPQLSHAARSCPGMEPYVAILQDKPVVRLPQLSGPDAVAALSTLRTIQFTCVFLALKVADKVHALGLLRFMLSKLSHDGATVSPAQAASIEAKCLRALDWRLGPFFIEDEGLFQE